MTDEAKAIAAIAEASGKFIDATHDSGSYLAQVFGSVPQNLVGLAGGDWIAHQRRRNLARLQANTDTILQKYPEGRRTAPNLSVAIPLLTAAADEAREVLQNLWATLLANAMLDEGNRIRRDFIETARQLDPFDALVLDIHARLPNKGIMNTAALTVGRSFISKEKASNGISEDNYDISIEKLQKINCINKQALSLSAYGRAFVAACSAPSR